jgi:hypothetical protein
MKTSGSDTENLHRILGSWLELDRALKDAGTDRATVRPGNCDHPRVHEIWSQITDPQNLRTLEIWFYYLTADTELEAWTREAIAECRRRSDEQA